MSMSPISRRLRPAILLAGGILLGQGALTIAAPNAPAATRQTRVASCAGYDFHPIDNRTQEAWKGRVKYRRTSDGDGWFLCNANLPNRALVTKVRFTLMDDDDLQEVKYCGLIRTPLATTGATKVLALAGSGTGVPEKPGVKRYSTTEIENPTVANAAYAYSFQCAILIHPSRPQPGEAAAGIIGADVTYTISSANG